MSKSVGIRELRQNASEIVSAAEAVRHFMSLSAASDGLPFGQREADIYRELCAIVATAGRSPGGKRRIDLMIAAIAIGDGAALATRNTSDFDGLEPLLQIITL